MRAALGLTLTMLACATPKTAAPAPAPPAAPTPASDACPTQLPAWTDRAVLAGAVVERVCLVGASEDDYLRLHELVAPREGRPLDPEAVRRDIQDLYASGFVKDVLVVAEPLGTKGVVLIYGVTQYERIGAAKLDGAQALTREEFADLARLGLPASPMATRALVAAVKALYVAKGYPHAEVDARLDPLKPGLAALTVTVKEGARLTLSTITFSGVKQAPVADLRKVLASAVGGVYSEDVVERDALALLGVLYDRGMISAKVDPQPPREVNGGLELTFTITEGDVFRVGKVALKGTSLGPEKDVLKKLMTRPGFVFSRSVIRADIELLRELGHKRGVEVDVTPITEIKSEAQRVDLVFEVEARPSSPARE